MNVYLKSVRSMESTLLLAAIFLSTACKIVGSSDASNELAPTDITASMGLQQQLEEIRALTGYRPAPAPLAYDLPVDAGVVFSAVEELLFYKFPESKHSRSFVKTLDSLIAGAQGREGAVLLKDICARVVELDLPASGSAGLQGVAQGEDSGESCGKRVSLYKVDDKTTELDYRFLSEMVQEPYLTDSDLRLVAAHENIRTTLERNLSLVDGRTEQYRLSWTSHGVQRVALFVFGVSAQKFAVVQYRLAAQ